MTLRIGICDDSQKDMNTIISHINTYGIKYDTDFELQTFLHGSDLLHAHNDHAFHLILLDIEMPEHSGLEIAGYLRNQQYDNVFIAFITSYPQYMQDSFEVQPFQFLTKPVRFESVEKLISSVERRFRHSQSTKIIIDSSGTEHLININEILYIQTVKGQKLHLEFHLQDSILTGRGRIQDFENELSSQGFLSPARGYLVNVRHIRSIQQLDITLNNQEHLTISRRKIKDFQKIYANLLITFMN